MNELDQNKKIHAETTKLMAETAKIIAETAKINKQNQWYVAIAASVATLAIIAVVKAFF